MQPVANESGLLKPKDRFQEVSPTTISLYRQLIACHSRRSSARRLLAPETPGSSAIDRHHWWRGQVHLRSTRRGVEHTPGYVRCLGSQARAVKNLLPHFPVRELRSAPQSN